MNQETHDHSVFIPPRVNTAFMLAVALNFVFTVIEAGYAIYGNSVSLLADAGHNLGDVLGLAFAWLASWLMTRPATPYYSYGFKRVTIFAAFFNALMLVITAGIIAYESVHKLLQPEVVNEQVIIIVAIIGTVINAATAALFLKDSEQDINIKGAFLHLAADAIVSIGVAVGGVIIIYTGFITLDPIMGLIIAVVIVVGTWNLMSDSVSFMLDAIPRSVDRAKVYDYLCAIDGVAGVHDLHIWGLSTRETALTVHLIMPKARLSDAALREINYELERKFAIHHATIQIEQGDCQDRICNSCDPDQ